MEGGVSKSTEKWILVCGCEAEVEIDGEVGVGR